MGLLDRLKQVFKGEPELPIHDEILERELKFNRENPDRKRWVLEHVYLCEGSLEELKKHPQYRQFGERMVCYQVPEGESGPCRPVRLAFPITDGKKATPEDIKQAENSLKLNLFCRNANAGVFYRNYEKDGMIFVEAVPATITIAL